MNTYAIQEIIRNAPHYRNGTKTNLGLSEVLRQYNDHPRSVPKNLLVITDGKSDHEVTAETVKEAEKVKKSQIKSIAVGVGDQLNMQELKDIAGGNNDQVFPSQDFEVVKLLRPISDEICENST